MLLRSAELDRFAYICTMLVFSGGREVAEIDEAYLSHCESEHVACSSKAIRTTVEQARCQSGHRPEPSNEGRRPKRKALLSMIGKWTAEGVPVELLRGGSGCQSTVHSY